MKEFIFEVERRVYGWMKDRLSIEAETITNVNVMRCLTLMDAAIRNAL